MKASVSALVSATIACVSVAPGALAQTEGSALEEVVVTAQKRSEDIQDVPISVSVLTEEELERSGINSLEDTAASFANVSFSNISSRASYTLLAIRGLSANLVSSVPRSAILVDDVPYTSVLSEAMFFDIEQVEVLRGPQSTLFGLTAEAGVLNIRTAAPRLDRWGGKVSAQTASNSSYEANLNVSGPVIPDRWSIGVSGYWQSSDGYLKNAFNGQDLDRSSTWAGRIRSLFVASDKLRIDLSYARQEISDDYGQALVPVDVARFNSDFSGVGDFDGNLDSFEAAIDFPGFTELKMDEASVRATYSLPRVDLVSVSAYRKVNALMWFDPGQTPVPWTVFPGFDIISGANDRSARDFTQEIRLTSQSPESKLTWVAGLFYHSAETASDQFINVGVPLGSESDEREARAIFGDMKYRFQNGVGLAVGARYEESESSGSVEFSTFNPPLNGLSAKTDESILLPRLVIDYKLANDNLLYASVSRGWLPGGVSIDTPTKRTYAAEKALNYELGAKSSWFDHRLIVRGAVFQLTVDDYQETTRELVINPVLSNIDEARIRGAELEVQGALTDALDLSLGVGYNDGEYTDFQNVAEDNTGNELPGVPRFNSNLMLTYSFGDGMYARGQWISSGKQRVLEDRENRYGLVDGHDVLNFMAGWDSDTWALQAFVNNISDKRYFRAVYDQLGDGRLLGSVGQSRQYGARVTWRF